MHDIANTCSDIGDPDNGNIKFVGDSTAPFSIGTMAVYDCDKGFRVDGDRVRVCVGGSQAWNGTETVCSRKYLLLSTKPRVEESGH